MKKTDCVPSDVSQVQKDWRVFLLSQGYCHYVGKGCAHAWRILTWYLSLPPTIGLSAVE